MSYAAPFSLLSFHLPDRDDSAKERLTWPLAGSLVIHVVVCIAFLSLRFTSSLEQHSGAYEVTLVTLPEISASPTASPESKSRPERKADEVPPPKAEAGETPKAPPQRKVEAISPPSPVPEEKPRVPELITDSLMRALDSVVVPKPQAPALPQKAAPVQAPALPSPPIKQTPAAEMDVQPIQAAPQPPKLALEPITGTPETPTPTPTPSTDPLAPTLKQAVDTVVVPKKPKQVPGRVSPAVKSDDQQKQNTTAESPSITLPSRAPRLAAVAPPEAPEKGAPPQTARERSTVESLTQAIQSVPIPERISKTPKPVAKAAPLVPEALPKQPRTALGRDVPTVVSPQAPQLARVPVAQTLVASEAAVPKITSESDTLGRQIAKLAIPKVPTFDDRPGFQQTESGTQETLALRVAGSSPKENTYWAQVQAVIAEHWIVHRVKFRYRQPLQVVWAFRVKRNGQVADLVVVRSSGNEKFDLAAKRAVVRATPLPPFPENVPNPSYDVQYTFTGPQNR